MRTYPIFLFVAVLLLSQNLHADDAKSDSDKLQGTWDIVKITSDGITFPEVAGEYPKLTFKGDKITGLGDSLTFKLLPDAMPKAMDITGLDGPIKNIRTTAIYELNGDDLKLCFQSPSPNREIARPTEFKSPRKSDIVLYVLKRLK